MITTFILEFRSITRPEFLALKSNIFRPDTLLLPRTLSSSFFESFLICRSGFHLLKSTKVRDSVIGFSIAKTRHSTHPSYYSCKEPK
ncbi:hypothetical protein GQ457_16G026070 [Hibiscus cannabinus]